MYNTVCFQYNYEMPVSAILSESVLDIIEIRNTTSCLQNYYSNYDCSVEAWKEDI